MRLHIDLATNQIVQSQTRLTSLSSISGKRGDIIPLELVFVSGGAGVPVDGEGPTITFGAKVQGDYGGELVVLSTTFSQQGTAPNIYYAGTLDLNTAELLAAMDDSADYLDLMAEVTWTNDDGDASTSQTIKLRVANDIVRGDEAAPVPLPTRAVELEINNISGSAVTFNDVLCADSATTPVGSVDPLAVTYFAPDGGTITSQADGSLDVAFASGTNLSLSGTLALPAVTRPGSTVVVTIAGA